MGFCSCARRGSLFSFEFSPWDKDFCKYIDENLDRAEFSALPHIYTERSVCLAKRHA